MNKKILLIDDDEDELDIFTEALEMASIKCDCLGADSGDKALDVLDTVSPDIIFLDINMPRMNGLDCLKHIRKKAGYINTPVIIYSTGITTQTTVLAETLGATRCIRKTGSISSLSRILMNLFVSF
jgi:DNA-binding response OmpR family regulator